VLALLGTALTTACDRQEQGYGFEVRQVQSAWSNGEIRIDLEQQLSLSQEAREALVHGVPLSLRLELILRDTRGQVHAGSETRHYEIRYLPLSDHYQLSGPEQEAPLTFPRLRHVLAGLASIQVSMDTGALPQGSYEILARSSLDPQKMPPPMRLPMLFSPQWRHDSEWSAWPIEIRPQA
jgi:hypothetical protein